MIRIKSQVLATAIIYLPLPLLSFAPSTIPGKSNNYIFDPLYYNTPGIHVNVVNSHAAIFDSVSVNFVNKVDFPTDGKPINPIQASPFLATSNPSPPPPLDLAIWSNYSLFNFAIFAFNKPKCPSVFLFF